MNVKIQGGRQGEPPNTGTCSGIVSYLQHEDAKRQEQGERVEPFFNNRGNASIREVRERIDQNKAKLSKTDAKFYVIVVSPSQAEIKAMGNTPEERSKAFREYINNDVMQNYAQGFNKGLQKDDLLYYAKIHHERKAGGEMDMHAHIIVSRKDAQNTKKLSPQTNHRGNGNTGVVKGGFNRSEFYQRAEQGFDKRFQYNRDIRQSYYYLNAMENGTIKEKQEAIRKAVSQEQTTGKEVKQEKRQEQQQERRSNRGLSR